MTVLVKNFAILQEINFFFIWFFVLLFLDHLGLVENFEKKNKLDLVMILLHPSESNWKELNGNEEKFLSTHKNVRQTWSLVIISKFRNLRKVFVHPKKRSTNFSVS